MEVPGVSPCPEPGGGCGSLLGVRALVTGINGQDGRYLAELLTAKGYDVVGTVQPGNTAGAAVVGRECPDAVVLEADLADGATLLAAVEEAQPDEVYNLAAFSSVSASWQQAEHASDITATGVVRLLEALRIGRRWELRRRAVLPGV